MNYYVQHEGQTLGPYTEAELREALAQSRVSLTDPGQREGSVDWVPLTRLLPPALPPTRTSVTGPLPAAPPPRMPMPLPLPPQAGGSGLPLPQVAPARPATSGPVVWPWIVGGVIVVIVGLFAMAAFSVGKNLKKAVANRGESELPIMAERAKYKQVWKKSSYEAAGPADKPPAGVFDLTHYPSEVGPLAAYVTPDPKDGKKHPAIVWAHGGFGGIGSSFWEEATKDNDQSARAFREAGIVMMVPSWRGENDNPGRFELFYGEVNDLLAAVEHVKSLPYVDPDRVYVGGHSTGGTLTLLASVASDKFRAAFSFGGMPDGNEVLAHGEGFGNTPYDSSKSRSSLLRSPIRYVKFIKRPTFYFEGEDNPLFLKSAQEMAERAGRTGAPFQAFALPGTHFDILDPITRLITTKIQADTGEVCNISFTPAELHEAYDRSFPSSPQKVIAGWMSKGGDLSKLLEEMKPEDTELRRQSDIRAVQDAMRRLADRSPQTAETTRDMAALAELCNTILDDEVYETMEKRVMPTLLEWARKRLQQQTPVASDEEADDYLQILQALQENGDAQKVLPVVLEAAKKGWGTERYGWSNVLKNVGADVKQLDRMATALKDPLPPGFIAVALLDVYNNAKLKDNWKGQHPFDNEAGVARLKVWLQDPDREHFSMAHSAAVGLAFISPESRTKLMPLALQHPSSEVVLEAAWADLRNNGTEGLAVLQKAALDVHQSVVACRYLEELKRGQDIPAEAKEPGFAAKAKMSEWLQHPNEVGAAPLSLEVYDQTELFWPPYELKRPVWLFKFTYRFASETTADPVKTGYGMVGGMTWSFFSEDAESPTPESLYIKHCALELEHKYSEEEDEEDEEMEEDAEPPAPAKPEVLPFPADAGDFTTEQWREFAKKALAKGNPGRFGS